VLTTRHILDVEILEALVAVNDVRSQVKSVTLVVQHTARHPWILGYARTVRLAWRGGRHIGGATDAGDWAAGGSSRWR
jgi:hypothetical protein